MTDPGKHSGGQGPDDTAPQDDTEQGNRAEQGNGAGPEGTIPENTDGVAAASSGEASNFEPEEDTDAADGGD